MFVIDAHTHMFPAEVRERPGEVEDAEAAFKLMFGQGKSRMTGPETMLSEMDAAGVDMAVLCPFPWTTLERCAENNDYLLDVASYRPERFLPFAVTSPALGKGALREARRCLEAGARGLGELHAQPQGFDLSDRETMAPLMELAMEYGVPVMIHVNEPVGHDYPGKGPVTPQAIYGFVREFPGVDLILPHWGGGLPFYELMPEVAEACARVYYDSAASPYLYRGEVYRLAAAAAGTEKILFATDYPLLPYERTLADARGGMAGSACEQAVLGGNAARLFRVDISGNPEKF
ncbi:MAG: amidohydrolase family protein [Actinomycetota bacterium]|nr:amidohydrolase family protein [Actinomycetota bacterium]MDD5666349.1 amidohydrolase family protein [Actinomycetota bacterium]